MALPDLRRHGRPSFLALYLILLGASHAWRMQARPHGVEAVADQRLTIGDATTMAFSDTGEPGDQRPAVLLLHGSPGSSRDFGAILAHGDEALRWLSVDLPGFGSSGRELDDYSFKAHAAYVEALLDARGIQRVHLFAFSMGGGVALNLYARDRTRVASLILLSSIGVQQLELLGDYDLNHALHALQLGGLWFLHEGLPHFGALDDSVFDLAFARNFFDSDQRPLRGILEVFDEPVLILHGEKDPLVPYAAALEHHRIVPQSELRSFPEGHFLLWQRGAELAAICGDWVGEVEKGKRPRRVGASVTRLERASLPFDSLTQPEAEGIVWLLLIALLVAGTFIAEDLSCLGAGILIAQGRLGWIDGVAACAAGIFFGDLLLYASGRWVGTPLFARRPLRWVISPRSLAHAEHWFARRGIAVIFITRFIPGTRLPAYAAAGMLRTPFLTFTAYFLLAVVLWTPAVVSLAAILGAEGLARLQEVRYAGAVLLLLLSLFLFLSLRVVIPLASSKGRRIWWGRLQRVRRWEFWPAWLFYVFLLPHLLRLSWRHGGFHTATAVNPGIETGGLLGESKAGVLDAIGRGRPELASYVYLPENEGLEARLERIAAAALAVPLVLKPDVGERGRRVQICRRADELHARLAADPSAMLAQEFVEGLEFGLFFLREPKSDRGRIFSLARKILPELVADGVSTIEDLILGDDRAVCLASFHLDRFDDRLDEIPKAGERLRLAELGTHCLGAVFQDGSDLNSPALLAAVETILEDDPEFHFGRFDLKAPSEDDLRAGRDLRVLELNGLSSEAAHIYDPKYSLAEALECMRQQWSLAFEIAAVQRSRGARPTPALRLAGKAVQHLFRASR